MPKSMARRDPYKLVGTTLGKYDILELVGTGGMGAVYRARHVKVQKLVALKILKPDLALEGAPLVRLFFEEAVKAGRLDHPNIIKVTDAELTEDEIAFLVMEWLDGRTLDAELEENGVFPVERAASLLEQICDAVDYAHRQGIIHRDLKPSNIMVCADHRGRETVKILDFGIAKALDSTIGLNSRVLGAPYYASPEQLTLSASIDHRADIYSLGVTVYQLLTGRLPFNEESIEKVIQQHLSVSPPFLRAERPELSEAVEAVVLRALAKRPGERYQSSVELARAFRQAAVGAPGALELLCADEAGRPMAGAVVYLDGQYVGQTDALGLWRNGALSPRGYVVEVSRPGYVSLQKEVQVEANGEATFKLYLVEKGSGDLTVRAGVAGARVLLNGSAAGTTDGSGTLFLRDLKPGEVEVEVSHRKCQPCVRRVRVVKGQTSVIEMTLSATPRFAALRGAASKAGRATGRWFGESRGPNLKALVGGACLLAAVCVAAALMWRNVLVESWHTDVPGGQPAANGSPTPAVSAAQIELARKKGVAAGHVRSGDELYELKPASNYAGAEKEYLQAVTLDPENAEYHFKLAASQLKQGKYETAEKEFRDAVRLDPSCPKYHLNLGYALSMMNDPSKDEEVLSEYREAIRLAEGQGDVPAQADYYKYLARALITQGQIDEGNKSYKKAEALKKGGEASDGQRGTSGGGTSRRERAAQPPLEQVTLPPPPQERQPPPPPAPTPTPGNTDYYPVRSTPRANTNANRPAAANANAKVNKRPLWLERIFNDNGNKKKAKKGIDN